MTVYLEFETIKNLTDEQVMDILENGSYKSFIDENYKKVEESFSKARKEMQKAESMVETRLFVFRDHVLSIMEKIGDSHEDHDKFDEYLTEFMQDATSVMATDSSYIYTDYDYYGHGDVDAFWIPSTC